MNDAFVHCLKNKVNIIYGTGTDVGKTYITLACVKNLLYKSKDFFAIKPILTGFDANAPENTDTIKISKCLSASEVPHSIEYITHQHFIMPASPDIAAKYENREIVYEDVLKFCQNAAAKHGTLIIETAGGVMTPLTKTHTMRDLSLGMVNVQNILVTSIYLGAISHTLSALECLKFDWLIINNINKENVDDFLWSIKNHLRYDINIHVYE